MPDQSVEVPIVLLVTLSLLASAAPAGLLAHVVRRGVRTRRIQSERNDILGRLALVAEFRDHRARGHARRVARTAGLIARELGVPPGLAHEIGLAAQFFDIGKVAIPDAVLLEQGDLAPPERQVVESHTLVGAELLSGESGVLELAAEIALTHHEHWDGSGYPHGLRGEEIPLGGRVVAVADAFHASVQRRPDRAAVSVEIAVAAIERGAGRQFDPAVVDAFSALNHYALTARDPTDEEASRPSA